MQACGFVEGAVQMNSVRPSWPPSTQAMARMSPVEIQSIAPVPSLTRITPLCAGSATQIAPSASRQMPSGTFGRRSAQIRGLASEPSGWMS